MEISIPPVERPAHVPADRVKPFDYFSLHARDVNYQKQLHDVLCAPGMPDVFWTPNNTGHWVAARGHVAKKVLTDNEHFSSRKILVVDMMNPVPPFAPLMIDPPDHTQYRNLLMKAMSPGSVSALGEKARKLAIELIEGFKARGECEFVGDFATHLPIAIFMSMVNLPEKDRDPLMKVADTLVRGESMLEIMEGTQKLNEYAQQIIAERTVNPGNDLISELTQAKINGEPVQPDMIVGMVKLLLLAGLDTVASMMGFFAAFLAENAEYRRKLLAHPENIATAVEEMLRRFPVANLAREIIKDVEIDGVLLKAGEKILVPTVAYGLDDRVFENPETVDFERANKIHETFGDGAHRCMGSMLARVELRVFIEEWLKRIPDFRIKPGTEIFTASGNVAGIKYLPLEWEVA